jgi:RNA polymerase sigma-70 factor (ECF subfamily)
LAVAIRREVRNKGGVRSAQAPLASVFLPLVPAAARAALAPEDDGAALAALEESLGALWDKARAGWPDLALARDGFLRHVAERLGGEGEPKRRLEGLHAADLYLAYGCAVGDAAALAAFERHFMPQVTAYLGRKDALAGLGDDLKQQLRARLLVADGVLVPRIGQYSGRGPLGAWLRVAAARLAINMREAERPTVPMDDEAPAALRTAIEDPELAYLRVHYGHALREAIREALAALEPRQATVLRLFFFESMTHEAIGAVLQASERTARRWVSEARARILDLVRQRLADRLSVPEGQLDTIIRLAREDLGASIVQVLKDPRGEP